MVHIVGRRVESVAEPLTRGRGLGGESKFLVKYYHETTTNIIETSPRRFDGIDEPSVLDITTCSKPLPVCCK